MTIERLLEPKQCSHCNTSIEFRNDEGLFKCKCGECPDAADINAFYSILAKANYNVESIQKWIHETMDAANVLTGRWHYYSPASKEIVMNRLQQLAALTVLTTKEQR